MTVGNSALPRYAWLVKGFSDTTRNEKERFVDEKLRSARVEGDGEFYTKNRCEISECKVCNFAMYFASQSLRCNEKAM